MVDTSRHGVHPVAQGRTGILVKTNAAMVLYKVFPLVRGHQDSVLGNFSVYVYCNEEELVPVAFQTKCEVM
jgi:hypothetical protein